LRPAWVGRGKSVRPHLNRKRWTWWCMPVIPAMQGNKTSRITVHTGLGIKRDPTSKITKTKKGWGNGFSGRVPT
jgi:hypothetical protein